uniref:Transposase n=1 Tax=Elaeophora elaphi TaxID=1147741 RepID=A0A0R3RVI7_9BILA
MSPSLCDNGKAHKYSANCNVQQSAFGNILRLKYQLKGHPMHADEMKDYRNAEETFVALKEGESFDCD